MKAETDIITRITGRITDWVCWYSQYHESWRKIVQITDKAINDRKTGFFFSKLACYLFFSFFVCMFGYCRTRYHEVKSLDPIHQFIPATFFYNWFLYFLVLNSLMFGGGFCSCIVDKLSWTFYFLINKKSI